MKYLHTMIRVVDLKKSLSFYQDVLEFKLVSQSEYPDEKFTLAFLRAAHDENSGPLLELTYNWEQGEYEKGNAYGHMAYLVESIDMIKKRLQSKGHDLSWGPGASPNGKSLIAFIDDPDGHEIELIERKE